MNAFDLARHTYGTVWRYDLEPLTAGDLAQWDELIAPYASTEFFHRKAWLDYLAASRQINTRFSAIPAKGRLARYFCGGVGRKGLFRILGNPLKDWTNKFMGPAANNDLGQEAVLGAFDAVARQAAHRRVEPLSSPAVVQQWLRVALAGGSSGS